MPNFPISNPVRNLKEKSDRIFSGASSFPVNIQSGFNDVFTLNTKCSINTMIRELKDIIIREKGLENGQHFTLKYNNIVMEDHETLGSHNINDYRHLILMVSQVGPSSNQANNNVTIQKTNNNDIESQHHGNLKEYQSASGSGGAGAPLLNNIEFERQYRRNLREYQSASQSKVVFVIQALCTIAIFYTFDIVGLAFSYQYDTDCGNKTIPVPPRDFSAPQIMRWNAWGYIIGITIVIFILASPRYLKLDALGGLTLFFIVIWSIIFSIAGITLWNSNEFDGCKATQFGKMLIVFSSIKISFWGLLCCFASFFCCIRLVLYDACGVVLNHLYILVYRPANPEPTCILM